MLGEMTYANFVERYRDKAYIGSGGFAKVYKVYDYANNNYVALKIADVRPELKKFTLQNEVALISQLPGHENIVSYDSCYRFNTGIAGEMDFAILPYYENGNLDQFLNKKEINDAEKKQIIIGILKGINFLHQNNIIHRDLKAQNILIHQENQNWIPKIADFGLGRNVNAHDSAVSNSSIGVSFEYAAPEQIRNRKIYKNVDLWAVGVLLFRILTGVSPFRIGLSADENNMQSQLEISRRVMNLELPEVFNSIKEPFKTIIARCLVLEPKDRVRDAGELLALLNVEDAIRNTQDASIEDDQTVIIENKTERNIAPVEQEEKTVVIEDKTIILEPQAPVRPRPKQDFQYKPRTNFDLPVYENPRKNVTQIFVNPSHREEEAPPPVRESPIRMNDAGGTFNKMWIYLPIFLLCMTVGVWLLYNWLNPAPQKQVISVAPETPVVESVSSIPPAFIDCFEKGKNSLQGTFKLIPTDQFLNTFETLDASCLDNICNQLNAIQSNTDIFYRLANNGNACIAPLLNTSLAYHHQQIKENNSLAIFYNSGQSNLSIAQKNELNTFLKKYKRNADQHGLLIIGRASNSGNKNANRALSRSRAESIMDFVSDHYIKNLKTEFVYFGADPPQMTKSIADDYGIRNNKYANVKHGNTQDRDYALRLNQSVMLVIYEKKVDPFDLEK